MADMLDVAIDQRFHDWTQRILPNWSYGSHVCRFAFVALIPELVPQTLQALVLPGFEKIAQMLAAHISQKGNQFAEGLI
jgi:hypothetical protein